jgi:hypothetical protein
MLCCFGVELVPAVSVDAVLCRRAVLLSVLFCICWYLRVRSGGRVLLWYDWCCFATAGTLGAGLSRYKELCKRALYICNGFAWLCGGWL